MKTSCKNHRFCLMALLLLCCAIMLPSALALLLKPPILHHGRILSKTSTTTTKSTTQTISSSFSSCSSSSSSSSSLSLSSRNVSPPITDTTTSAPLFDKNRHDDDNDNVMNQIMEQPDDKMMENVIIPPDFTLSCVIGLLGPLIWWFHPSYMIDGSPSLIGIAGGGFHILLASILWVQTIRVRCVFEVDGFEFYNVKGPKLDLSKGAKLVKKPNTNFVTNTENHWKYNTIISYGFYPSDNIPMICYFKEIDTPTRISTTGTSSRRTFQWLSNKRKRRQRRPRTDASIHDSSYENGQAEEEEEEEDGQPHFSPVICNLHQFKTEMERRGVKRNRSTRRKSTISTEVLSEEMTTKK